MRLVDLDTLARGSQVLFEGTLEQGAGPQPVVLAWQVPHFQEKAKELAGQGMSMQLMHSYVQPGGGVRVNAVWGPGIGSTPWVQGWKRSDLLPLIGERASDDYSVVSLHGWRNGGGQERFDVVRCPGRAAAAPGAGVRIRGLRDGVRQELEGGVWAQHPGPPQAREGLGAQRQLASGNHGQYVVWARTREQVQQLYDEMWHQGMRLGRSSTG